MKVKTALEQELAQVAHDPARRKGHFLILSELGRGGMGVVYRAFDTRTERVVALKVVLETTISDLETRERFDREAKAVARLRHPNIVQVYEANVFDKGFPYISMEFIEGEPLDKRQLPIRQAVSVMCNVALAVDHAHKQGVLHRDIKPGNILIGNDGRARLLDFGMAKITSGGARSITATGSVVGTPIFMSPEQAMDSKSVDKQADIYSLGATLYTLVTGAMPFTGSTAVVVLRAIMEDAPVPPSEINPSVDRKLEALILKCMEKDPEKRPKSAADFSEQLDGWLSGDRDAAVAGVSWRTFVLSLAAASIGSSLVTGTLARRSAPAPVLASPTPASVSTPTPVASPVASPVAPKPAREVHDTKPEASPTIKDLVQAEALVTASNRKLGANDPTGALADADRAVELTPDSAKVYVNRGWIRRQTGNLPGALKDYDKAIELTPQYAMAWSNRSDAKRVTSDYTGAIADATQAISLAPSLPWPYLNRGLSKLELNDQSGIDDLEKFLIMEPTGPTADAVRKQLEKAR